MWQKTDLLVVARDLSAGSADRKHTEVLVTAVCTVRPVVTHHSVGHYLQASLAAQVRWKWLQRNRA